MPIRSRAGRLPPSRAHQCDECKLSFYRAEELHFHKLTEHHKEELDEQREPPFGRFVFDLQPPKAQKVLHPGSLGRFRGIQGENNSCYLDASIMALFFADNSFDFILEQKKLIECQALDQCREFLRLHIVNQLRTRGYVPSAIVFQWRLMIATWFGETKNFDRHCSEEEACEFIQFLLASYGSDDLTSSTRSTRTKTPSNLNEGQFMFQLLAPASRQEAAWTTEQLLADTLGDEKLEFSTLGKVLILQVPRYGKMERVIDAMIPSPFLHLKARSTKYAFELKSILVIGTSHFVAYMRVAEKGSVSWLYFDSMSDRVKDTNVPAIEDVTEQLEILESSNADGLIAREMKRSNREHLKRVVQDVSMMIYKKVKLPKQHSRQHSQFSLRNETNQTCPGTRKSPPQRQKEDKTQRAFEVAETDSSGNSFPLDEPRSSGKRDPVDPSDSFRDSFSETQQLVLNDEARKIRRSPSDSVHCDASVESSGTFSGKSFEADSQAIETTLHTMGVGQLDHNNVVVYQDLIDHKEIFQEDETFAPKNGGGSEEWSSHR